MNRKVYIADSKIGKGVFAREDIRKGEPIFFLTGKYLTYDEVLKLPGLGHRTIQVDRHAYISPLFPATYINHNCDPNAGIRDDLCFIALRDIPADTEVCFDYSTSMLERDWTMKCGCGSPNCRKVITDFDHLPKDLQRKYIDLGVVQQFILREIFSTDNRAVA